MMLTMLSNISMLGSRFVLINLLDKKIKAASFHLSGNFFRKEQSILYNNSAKRKMERRSIM